MLEFVCIYIYYVTFILSLNSNNYVFHMCVGLYKNSHIKCLLLYLTYIQLQQLEEGLEVYSERLDDDYHALTDCVEKSPVEAPLPDVNDDNMTSHDASSALHHDHK